MKIENRQKERRCMLKLGIYRRKSPIIPRDSYLLIFKPKDNMFETAIPRELCLDVGFSLCSHLDQFKKKTAREIANKRLSERTFKLVESGSREAEYLYSDSNFVLTLKFDLSNGYLVDYQLDSVEQLYVFEE